MEASEFFARVAIFLKSFLELGGFLLASQVAI
jgi:hypothetical protein